MTHCRTLLATAALLLAAAPAQAYDAPQFNAPAPIPHVQDVRFADQDRTPYAMRYSDEAAESLGVKDGKWEAFSTKSSSPLMPSLNAGADSGGAMIKLQWQ
ncbi:MAG: hypothetical protein JWN16_774 [Alphaproteobacteria bacterium]|nr:hypothetical protein [Alphaproteobacteria bacterium]